MVITFTEQNAIFQPTAFVWEVFRDDYYLRNYLNNERSISKRKMFPTFPAVISLCSHPLPERQRGHTSPQFHQYSFPTGDGAEVNDTLIGIFLKPHKTLNRGWQQEMSHYHVIVVFNLKALYTQAVMSVYCDLIDEMRVLMAIASFHQPA